MIRTATLRAARCARIPPFSSRCLSTLPGNPHIYVAEDPRSINSHLLTLLPTDPPTSELALGTTSELPPTTFSFRTNERFVNILNSVLAQHSCEDKLVQAQASSLTSSSVATLFQTQSRQRRSATGAFEQAGAAPARVGGWIHVSDLRKPPDFGRIADPEDIFGSLEVDADGDFVDGHGRYQASGTYRIVTRDGVLGLTEFLREKLVERLKLEEANEKNKKEETVEDRAINRQRYQITQTNDRGIALTAARRIPAGTLILSEPALIKIPLSAEHDGSAIDTKVHALSKAERKNCLPNLTFSYVPAAQVANMITTGAVAVAELSPIDQANALKRGLMQFHAIKNISKGKELMSNYEKSIFVGRKTRIERLRRHYGFDCSLAERAAAKLQQLEGLLLKEGLTYTPLANCYKSLAKWTSRMGQDARPWLEKEEEVVIRCFGRDSQRAQTLAVQLSQKRADVKS
ncbi:hypothetical protein DV735_g4165, partial [Chaetothyriales sp. CBS 134920]